MTKPDRPFAPSLRDMAYVPRWAILRRNRTQNLAEHSYYVAVYADQIARMIEWSGDYSELMRYALYHDLDETITGDIPGPAKRAAWDKKKAEEHMLPVMTAKYGRDIIDTRLSASREVRSIVSAADAVEEVCYLSEEALSGNSTWTKPVAIEALRRMEDRWYRLPCDPFTLTDLWNAHMAKLVSDQMERPILLEDVI